MDVRDIIQALSQDLAERTKEGPRVTMRAHRGWPRPEPTYEVVVATTRHSAAFRHRDPESAVLGAFQLMFARLDSDDRVIPIQVVETKRSA